MPLDFPSNPTNGQTYDNYYYDATVGAWNSFSSTTNTIPSTLKNLSVSTDTASGVPLTVNGVSGQTANLQEWVNSAGSGVASLTNSGTLTVQTLNLTNDLTVANGGTGASTFTTGAYLKGNGASAIQSQLGIPFADVTMQAIPAAADLNTYVVQGIYHQSSDAQAAGGTNYPIARAGLLEVYQSGTDGTGSGFTYQRYTAYQSFYGIYTRAKYSTTWGAWEEVPTGTVTVPQGGTGVTTLTSGAYLKGAGTSAITAQTGIPAGDITSGTLDVVRGGTGTTVGSGLVPIVPSSVSVGSGSASVSSTGTVTFTGATSISLNSVFSSTYRHYRIVIDTPTTSGTGNLTVRFRSGTTDDAVNTYFQYWTMKRLTGAFQDNSGGPSTSYSLYGFLVSGGSPTNSWSGDVIFPNVATTQTWITGQGFGYDATSTYMVNSSVLYNSAKAFDGISFFSAAQLTGTVKVLGYR
jgi:hypothetical protein